MITTLPVLAWALHITIGMVTLAALLNVYRLIKGPDAPDRVLALDTLYINAIALIILLGITLETRLYMESALLIAVMGFVGTVALAKYLKRGSVIE
ncbi:MAG: K+/H+ antiporter subunit F [Marinobacter sp.]|uniref:K+/H+ antiporter subunit F n=1 Tax=Marinobacter sp. TaxID=50741 RepID=UPI00299D82B2|nr:K+/H+ antiporter subunit F [Marinobacter sp.]MDX1756548.1 K+/H+ antiporter subunit F [Marinobacter sp.]